LPRRNLDEPSVERAESFHPIFSSENTIATAQMALCDGVLSHQ
jgi:hypothetical protein